MSYLIWSNEHRRWWAPGNRGYVTRIESAGRYSRDEALRVCANAMPGRRGPDPLPELPVRLEDAEAMLALFAAAYPGFDPEP